GRRGRAEREDGGDAQRGARLAGELGQRLDGAWGGGGAERLDGDLAQARPSARRQRDEELGRVVAADLAEGRDGGGRDRRVRIVGVLGERRHGALVAGGAELAAEPGDLDGVVGGVDLAEERVDVARDGGADDARRRDRAPDHDRRLG